MIWRDLNISEDAKSMLDDLVERKNTLETWKNTSRIRMGVTFLLALVFSFYFYFSVIAISDDVVAILKNMVQYKFNVVLFAMMLFCYLYWVSSIKEVNSAEKKLDTLRDEIIERMDTTWLVSSDSATKDQISRDMDNNYGINIIYKA